MSSIDKKHVATVVAVLEVIARLEPDIARGALAAEDAFIALRLGLTSGLADTRQVAQGTREIGAELSVETWTVQ